MSEAPRTLGEQAEGELEAKAAEVVVQLVRALRVVGMHELGNEAVAEVAADLLASLNDGVAALRSVHVQCVNDNVYLNNQFVRLRGAAFEAAIQVRRLFKRLGLSEIAFLEPLTTAELMGFLARFRELNQSAEPERFAALRLPKMALRSASDAPRVGIDRRLELARALAQTLVLVEDTTSALEQGATPALSRLRRALQELAEAATGEEALLVGLLHFRPAEPTWALHAGSVAAFTLLLGLRLGLARRPLVELALAAVFHDLARGLTRTQGKDPARQSALAIAGLTTTREALERALVALEHGAPGEAPGTGAAARLIGVACAYDLLVRPPGGARGILPELALRALADGSGTRFDRRAVRLFASVVGRFPVGSLVRLSGGQVAVVLSAPEEPNLAARPRVRVVRDKGAPADHVLELAHAPPELRIVESLDPEAEALSVTRYLLA